jgi:hypothetical protein
MNEWILSIISCVFSITMLYLFRKPLSKLINKLSDWLSKL